jgi:hypothetical protein
MPQWTGALTCDLSMFGLGVMAKRNGWLEGSLESHLDIHPILLVCMVVAEITSLVLLARSSL